jgi:RNA polymerase sigma-70 factor (ECF subfamily)
MPSALLHHPRFDAASPTRRPAHPERRTTHRRPAPPARDLDREALYAHYDRLFRAARSLTHSREDAEDLVQETYVQVLRRPRKLHGDSELGYLLRALRNTWISRHRAAGRRAVTVGFPDEFDVEDPMSGRRPEPAAEAREVFAAVSAQPQHHRDVLLAVDVVGLSYKETASALDVPVGTVMSRLYRARDGVARTLGMAA